MVVFLDDVYRGTKSARLRWFNFAAAARISSALAPRARMDFIAASCASYDSAAAAAGAAASSAAAGSTREDDDIDEATTTRRRW